MVAQQYGPQVRSDVISDAVKSTFADAIREQNLRIAGNPRIEPKADAAAPDRLEFSAVFEIYPEVQRRRPLRRHHRAAADGRGPRRRRTHDRDAAPASAPATNGLSARRRDGDRVIVDFNGKIDGVAFPGGQASDFPIVLGEGRMLPEFEAAVTGMTEGETRTFALTFPADYHGKEVAGKEADVHADGEERRGGASCPTSTPSSRGHSASRAATSTI